MLFDILKTFKGSPDGRFAVDYIAGTQAELSDTLAPVAVKEGWARPVGAPASIENKAIVEDGRQTGMLHTRRKGVSK